MTSTEKLKELVCKLYGEQPLSVDKLPYTNEFYTMHLKCMEELSWPSLQYHGLWTMLMACRKDGSLPRKSNKKVVNKKVPLRDKVNKQPQGFGRI